jgi:hypothetical protein
VGRSALAVPRAARTVFPTDLRVFELSVQGMTRFPPLARLLIHSDHVRSVPLLAAP